VTSAAQMAAAAKQAFRSADAAVFAAAVSDFRPTRRTTSKQPKSTTVRTITLAPTQDVAATLGRKKGRRITIGFALEDHAGRLRAKRKLWAKHLDGIVLNDPTNIGADTVSAEFLDRNGRWTTWPRQSKAELARRIIRTIERMVRASRRAPRRIGSVLS
jgi:phosphopantothenoylcysteine decarboxylase/phosphopantothenate--cysteine ligase